jgi:hypothetical protein
MTTSNLSNDLCLAIESSVSEALTQYLPLKYQRWDDVRRQLHTLSKSAMWEWRQGQDCRILEASIKKLTELEKERDLGDTQKEAALKYTVRVWEISVIRQMASDLTGKKDTELHRKIPIFVRVLSRQSAIPKVALEICRTQDQAFFAHREKLSNLLKRYGELSKIVGPPVHDSELDAEVAKIQESPAQLQLKRLADESFSPFETSEAGPQGSLKSTAMTPGSTASFSLSSLSSLSDFFSRFTGSGSGASAYTRNTKDSNSDASA